MAHAVETRRHWPANPSWFLAGAGSGVLVTLILAGAVFGIRSERGPDVADTRSTGVILERLERALEQGDARAAQRAWHDAHVSALRADWQTRVAVGEAALRLRDAGQDPQAASARARQSYLAALFVARAERSREGAVRVAEAFAALGDEEPAAQSLRVADAISGPADADLEARQEALRARLSRVPALTTGAPEPARP